MYDTLLIASSPCWAPKPRPHHTITPNPNRPIDHPEIDGHAHRLRREPNSRSRARPDQQEGIVLAQRNRHTPIITVNPTISPAPPSILEYTTG
jgi:hypothetical protein